MGALGPAGHRDHLSDERPRRGGELACTVLDRLRTWPDPAVRYQAHLLLDGEGPASPALQDLADRLADFQWPDGGWSCDVRPQAQQSSLVETVLPLRAVTLLEGKRPRDSGFPVAVRRARAAQEICSTCSFAAWGPGGRTRLNPRGTVRALAALRQLGSQLAGEDSSQAS